MPSILNAVDDVKKYSINMMWINTTLNQGDDKFLSVMKKGFQEGYGHKDALSFYHSVTEWAKANPEATINLWYDSEYTTPFAVAEVQKILLTFPNIHLCDIRTIPIVAMNPDVFSDQVPIYLRVDLLKTIIVVDAIERGRDDSAIFADIEVGDKRSPDQTRRMAKNELFDAITLTQLNLHGLLMVEAYPAENQFLQLINHPLMIQAIKHIAINLNLHRIIHLLNTLKKNNKEQRGVKDFVFQSQLEELYPYFALLQSTTGELLLMPEGMTEPPETEEGLKQLERYDASKHGLGSLGLELDPYGSLKKITLYHFDNSKDRKLRFPATRKVSVRMGMGHTNLIKLCREPASGNEYVCTSWTGKLASDTNTASITEEIKERRRLENDYQKELDELLQNHKAFKGSVKNLKDSIGYEEGFRDVYAEDERRELYGIVAAMTKSLTRLEGGLKKQEDSARNKIDRDMQNESGQLKFTAMNEMNQLIRVTYSKAIDKFVVDTKKRYPIDSQQAHSIDSFVNEVKSFDTKDICSSEVLAEALRTQIMSCGRKHFKRAPALLRALADILMCVVFPVGAIIAAVNHAKSRPFFFYFGRQVKTQRLYDLEKSTEKLPTFKPKTH